VRLKEYDSRVRNWCASIEASPYFEFFILICIICNTITLAVHYYNIPEETIQVLTYFNYAFAAIFTLEAVFKLYALGVQDYFADGWNRFDLFIVVGTGISILSGNLSGNTSLATQTTLIRSFRIGRVFRLVQKAKYLKVIFYTFIITIPSLANIGGLLFLLIFIYAVLGVSLFS
jgi:hypothetical protein